MTAPDTLERVVMVAILAATIWYTVLVVRRRNARRLERLIGRTDLWNQLGIAPDGRPTLVTFSTPSCAACHRAQAPAARAVVDRLQEVRHVNVDAAAQPHVAKAFGVLTVPSTAILASAGQLVAVNQGFAPSAKLIEQILSA